MRCRSIRICTFHYAGEALQQRRPSPTQTAQRLWRIHEVVPPLMFHPPSNAPRKPPNATCCSGSLYMLRPAAAWRIPNLAQINAPDGAPDSAFAPPDSALQTITPHLPRFGRQVRVGAVIPPTRFSNVPAQVVPPQESIPTCLPAMRHSRRVQFALTEVTQARYPRICVPIQQCCGPAQRSAVRGSALE